MHLIDINDSTWSNALQKVYDTALEKERITRGRRLSQRDIIKLAPNKLPYVILNISNEATINALRLLPEVRYVEPLDYELEEDVQRTSSGSISLSSFGCGDETEPHYADLENLGNDIVPWTYDVNQIDLAWSLLSSYNIPKGGGITTAVIDSGVSDFQDLLGSDFSDSGSCSGSSVSRTIDAYCTLTDDEGNLEGTHDQCGHGTRMAGVIGAPSRCQGSLRGVAYECNIDSYRSVNDVYILGFQEKVGVAAALLALGDDNDARIISMSIGTKMNVNVIRDAIIYATNRGKLIFCAAGTSSGVSNFTGVVFPARLPQTIAVTGIKESADGYYNSTDDFEECHNCHKGSRVDFVVVMQRDFNNARTSASLTRGIDFSDDTPVSTNGSSVATATMAGIATLVWGADPNLTRIQVLNILRNASTFPIRPSNFKFGHGKINARDAVNAAIPPCDDTDGDGVNDCLDNCVDQPGSPLNGGCPLPDSDGDGVPDIYDNCPNVSGSAQYNGCQNVDSDGDGVYDANDQCPNQFGTCGDGCPPPPGDTPCPI